MHDAIAADAQTPGSNAPTPIDPARAMAVFTNVIENPSPLPAGSVQVASAADAISAIGIALPTIAAIIALHNAKPAPLNTDDASDEEEKPDGETAPPKPVDIIAPEGNLIGVPGNGPDVQELPDGYKGQQGLEGAQGLFGDLTKGQGGKDVTPDSYPPDGTMIKLPNGDIIGIRPTSKSNVPTVDTKISNINTKFKFPK